MAEVLNVKEEDVGISLSTPMIMELIKAVHEKGATFRFQARGYSMIPAIRNGDVITVSPLKDIMPHRGDVMAFCHPQGPQMLVHRVLRVKKEKCFFKGDNCPEADGWVSVENILGAVTHVERQGRERFWPNRSAPSSWTGLYLFIYPLFPPLRRRLVRGYRFFKKKLWPFGLF